MTCKEERRVKIKGYINIFDCFICLKHEDWGYYECNHLSKDCYEEEKDKKKDLNDS